MTTPDDDVTGGVEPTVTPTADEPTEPTRPEGGRGSTLVKTLAGYHYQPKDTDIPVITPVGVLLTKEQAESVVDEAAHIPPAGFVYIDDESEG